MAPDAEKQHRRQGTLTLEGKAGTYVNDDEFLALSLKEVQDIIESASFDTADSSSVDSSVECVLQPRLLTDFSYMERPLRFTLTCGDKYLATNGKNAVLMGSFAGEKSTPRAEFTLVPLLDGTVCLQITNSKRFLCANPATGRVYTSSNRFEPGMERWILSPTKRNNGTLYKLTLVASEGSHHLSCINNSVSVTADSGDSDNLLWAVDFTVGEVCYISRATNPPEAKTGKNHWMNTNSELKEQIRCDMIGNITLSTNYQGWAAWRFLEVPAFSNFGYVRIANWAHNEYLSSNDRGEVYVTDELESLNTLWSVEKPSGGLFDGAFIRSAIHDRVLKYDDELQKFWTIPGSVSNPFLLDQSCAWDLESVHRQTYYVATTNTIFSKRLVAAKRGVTTRGLPGRLTSEEWKIEATDKYAVVTIFSEARQKYLASNEAGEVFMLDAGEKDNTCHWCLEDRGDASFVIQSQVSNQYLVAPERGPICTLEGTPMSGNTHWKLEPKVPPQVSKQKVQAVGAAVAIGVLGTALTPVVIGASVGILGIAEIGVAGQVAIGSIRAAEIVNTVTRVTLSSSQLMMSQSSFLEARSDEQMGSSSRSDKAEESVAHKRPFYSWRSW